MLKDKILLEEFDLVEQVEDKAAEVLSGGSEPTPSWALGCRWVRSDVAFPANKPIPPEYRCDWTCCHWQDEFARDPDGGYYQKCCCDRFCVIPDVQLKIGTWPTPDTIIGDLADIDTIPLPD